jgi:outer membrane protein OmpA-like peptidoglycan-associated protein
MNMKIIVVFCCLIFSLFTCKGQEKLEVYFDFNKYDLNPAALITLNDWILKHPDSKVLKIYGFCDWKGTNEYNDTLSIQRIQTVFDFLQEHQIQIDADYLKIGFGENFTQNKVQALNRKVEIMYLSSQPATRSVADSINEIKEKTFSDKIKTAKKGDLVRLKNINFYNNSARIVPKSLPILYDLLCVMEEHPNLKIEIQGHICCQPSNKMDHISTARARAIYSYLIQNKIQRNRLSYKGYGVTNPIYPIPEKSAFEEDENRRVEIKIIEN